MCTKQIIDYVFGEAAKSNAEKRKVGCVITDSAGNTLGKGYNTQIEVNVVDPDQRAPIYEHAEVAAIFDMQGTTERAQAPGGSVAYVSHPPCPDCATRLQMAGIFKVEVVKPFMKFDGDKTRHDLVPPGAIEYLAEVMTLGARKYKPNNWRECEDLSRYEGAMLRHIQAHRMGEKLDPETGLPHLAHAMANITFLLELDEALSRSPDLTKDISE